MHENFQCDLRGLNQSYRVHVKECVQIIVEAVMKSNLAVLSPGVAFCSRLENDRFILINMFNADNR